MKTKFFLAAALAAVCLAEARLGALEEAAITGTKPVTQPAPAPEAAQIRPGLPEAAKPAYTPKYLDETRQAMEYLSAMLAKQDRLEPEKLAETAKDITRLNEKLKALLGPEILKELEADEKTLLEKQQGAFAKGSLALVRSSLQIYYGDHNGVFPDNLGGLIPGYLESIPDLQLPVHEKTGKITVIDSKKYDDNLSSAVTDSGGWLYFSSPDSMNFGMLLIDCSHKAPGTNLEWYKY
ncbi:MAG: hypothetical protein NTX59_03035 [Elusimicrobia bacterium]|nr:hypothetical protein [Elusimicrobiota bacterium]